MIIIAKRQTDGSFPFRERGGASMFHHYLKLWLNESLALYFFCVGKYVGKMDKYIFYLIFGNGTILRAILLEDDLLRRHLHLV